MTTQEVSQSLNQIKEQLEQKKYQIPEKLLYLAKVDPEVYGFVNGQGGYHYQFLALFVKYFKPKNIVELGNAYGVSTLMMFSEMLPDAKLTSVDIFKDQRYLPKEVAGDKKVEMVIGDCLDLNIYNGKIPQNIDFLFTDTVHFYQQVKDEYDIYHHLLSDGAFVLIDDIYIKDKGKLYQELPFEKWDISSWCHYNGFGLFRYRKQKESTQPLADAALESARIGFRKFNVAQTEIENDFYRKFYAKIRNWAERNKKAAQFIRTCLKPLKKIYTPQEKKF